MAEDNSVQVIQKKGLQTISDSSEASRMADSLVRGAIESLQKPVTIPRTKGIDTGGTNDSVEEASYTRDLVSEIIDDSTNRFGMAIEGQKEAIGKGGKASAEGIMADQQRSQQEANLQKHFADLFGISTDMSSEIAVTAQRLRELKPGAEEKLRKVQAMQNVGLLDNPLEWLVNQVQLPAVISDYNRDADVVNYLQTTIDASIKTGQDAANFAGKGIPTITVAQAKAGADKVLALADQNKAIADENLAKTNVAFAVHKLAGDISIANATRETSSLELQNEHLKYTSMINEINLADKHSERLLRAASLIEKLEGTRGLDIILENYDRTMGHPARTTTRYVFEKFAEGQRQNIVAIGAGSLGADPFEGMINWYRSRPGPGASPETTRFFNYLRDKSEEISTTAEVQRMDEKQKPAIISKKLKEKIQEEFSGASKQGNIFHEMSPTQMIQSGALPPDSHLAKILEPFTKQTGPIDTSIVLAAIDKEYQNPGEAGAVISDYYKRNMQLRNSVMNTSLAGITLPKDYIYRKTMQFGGGFEGGGRLQFDLTDPTQATKYILIKRAGDIASIGIGTSGPFVEPAKPPEKVKKESPIGNRGYPTWKEINQRYKDYDNFSGVKDTTPLKKKEGEE
jgi:hypothetical protein